MTTLHNEAVMLNNTAVSLLDSGDLVQAVSTFRRAVSIMKCASGGPSSFLGSSTYNNTKVSTNFFHHIVSANVLPGLQTGLAYVLDRPLLIAVDDHDVDAAMIAANEIPFSGSVTVTSTVILYNFALACHYIGKTTGQDVALKQAYQLYALVLRCLPHEIHYLVGYEPQVGETVTVLQCLALNNLAQLQYELCEYQESRKSMERLLHTVLHGCAVLKASLGAESFQEIMLNLIHLKESPTAAHAA